MRRTLLLTIILVFGLILSQVIPLLIESIPSLFQWLRAYLTMNLLAYIMIEVGREFVIDLENKRKYILDYLIAATAAAFPWIFVTIYFFLFLMPEFSSTGKSLWMEALLAGRFAAPTSAGVLFSMLASAGLSNTWTYKKTRILAIFDDLDTILLMIPLQMMMVGLVWQLAGVLFAIVFMLILAYKYYRKLHWPTSWKWILAYSFIITGISELLYAVSYDPVAHIGLHIEVLLPAFLLGYSLRSHKGEEVTVPGEDEAGMHAEERAGLTVSCVFMFLVGFSMPAVFSGSKNITMGISAPMIIYHVIAVTFLSNLGKMLACFFYKKEASFKERLAVSISMFPRGEVGAGVLAITLGYGIEGPFVTVAYLSLALNLVLTGGFIWIVKKLLTSTPST
ncbi:MAG: hypothetical protein WC635_11720 [Bacteriovorax sp.]|jgi:Kef-type K+ transport system membrane component KefB